MRWDKYIDMAVALQHLPVGSKKHFSFIIRKNRIMSVGYNHESKSHTLAKTYGYPYYYIHSELDAIRRFPEPMVQMKNYTLVNVRLNKFNTPTLSRPCKYCSRLIEVFGFRNVYYTDLNGEFQEFVR